MGMEVTYLVAAIYLICNTISDFLWRRVLMIFSLGTGLFGIGFQLWKKELIWSDFTLGILLGIAIIIVSLISREMIGMGDGVVVLILGILLGGEVSLAVCVYAIMAAGLVGLFLLLIKKKSRQYKMPFVPFLLFGLLGTILLF